MFVYIVNILLYMMTKMEKLLNSGLSVFRVHDLAVLWGVEEKEKLWSVIRHYLRSKRIKRVYKGVYVVGEYSELELAQKLITPSYISLHTALSMYGISFQYYKEIDSIALISKSMEVEGKMYRYHQLKERVFDNSMGIEKKGVIFVAGPERAVCDSLYFEPSLGIDSLDELDGDKLKKISKIYDNERLERQVKKMIKEARR